MMGKSFVLRDAQRQVCGYYARGIDGGMLRLDGFKHSMHDELAAILFFLHGEWRKESIRNSAGEQTVVWKDEHMTAIAVCEGDRVVCASDDQAYARALNLSSGWKAQEIKRKDDAEKTEQDREKRTTTPITGKESAAAKDKRNEPSGEESVFHAKRWPPPPCMAFPQYTAGRWICAMHGEDSNSR